MVGRRARRPSPRFSSPALCPWYSACSPRGPAASASLTAPQCTNSDSACEQDPQDWLQVPFARAMPLTSVQDPSTGRRTRSSPGSPQLLEGHEGGVCLCDCHQRNQAGPERSLPWAKPCLCFLCRLWRTGVPWTPKDSSSKRVLLRFSLPGPQQPLLVRVITVPTSLIGVLLGPSGGKRSAGSEQDTSLTFSSQAPDPAAPP